MRRAATAAIVPIALLAACTIESSFVDMIHSKSYCEMVSVPGGTFTQSDGTDSFSHTISDFRIGKHEVTYGLWHTILQWALSNGYAFGHTGREGNDGTLLSGGAGPTSAKYEPVTTISWRDAVVWCNAYSEMSGYLPVYYSDSTMSLPRRISTDVSLTDTIAGSEDNPYVNWDADGFRLPTEGEWQYAAGYRDGTSWTPWDYASGAVGPGHPDDAPFTGLVAWYPGNSGGTTHDAGTKQANQLGIRDMSGNVAEWCWDWSGASPTGPESDYTGPASGDSRTFRGGSWDWGQCMIGVSGWGSPYVVDTSLGFRVARRP